ncbi:hypothetical protein BH18ACT17_BH18ACT17_03020 [soil metagenome]
MSRIARHLAAALTVTVSLMLPSLAQAKTPDQSWQMYRATNAARVKHSVGRLDRAHRLTDEATKHARAMARRGGLFHSGASRYGVRCRVWGENVGYTSGDVGDLQRAFMHSPTHRAHVLDRVFERVAVGAATDDRGRLYVALFFCT